VNKSNATTWEGVSGRSLDVVRDWDSRTEFGAMVFGNWELDSGGQLLGT
jgi:hypothetical protein